MKMRLFVHLVLPPPLQPDGKDTLIPSPFYICRFTAPPPHPAFLLAGKPAHHAVTFLAAGGQRAQRALVLVMLMPHMENGQG